MKTSLLLSLTMLLLPLATAAEPLRLPLSSINSWQTHSFVGEAEFSWQENEQCLLMRSDNTASARIWEQTLPMTDSTVVSWRWQPIVDITDVDQRSKAGDDYPGRIYVAVQHPLFFWRSRVLTYVHAATEPVNSYWPNPFSRQFVMVVVSNGSEPVWHSIERNISDDWYAAFGDRPSQFHALGVMADSDNTGQKTELCLADLKISNK